MQRRRLLRTMDNPRYKGIPANMHIDPMHALSLLQKGDVLGLRTNNKVSPPAPEVPVSSPPQSKKYRVMLCGTYPIGQSNGYSRVVYYIAKHLGGKDDIQLTVYGFQNYKQTAGSSLRSDIPSHVVLHDALATEQPARNGFGDKEIATYLKSHPQDMVIIFNDMVITSALMKTIVTELPEEEQKRMKFVSYMDQVYPYQKRMYIDMLNAHFDAVVCFTPYWRTVARKLGLRKDLPCYVFPHGFDHKLYYPVPRKVSRDFFHLPENAFIILNLNRNQPRKRWDHTMMAFADVLERYHHLKKKDPAAALRPIKLMIATQVQGFWDLTEILEHELMLRGVPVELGKESVVCLAKPQQMSDRDINILYNACDIGLNTCEGEGWGLCQSEHAAVGCPQVAPAIGGIQEFLHNDISTLIAPKWRYYIDKQRDGIGGIAEVGDPKDYADAIWKYYLEPSLVQEHGRKARRHILQHYQWSTVVDHFHRVIHDIRASSSTPASL
jgi:glycosyltransferase involved in cell wall biosynthesis